MSLHFSPQESFPVPPPTTSVSARPSLVRAHTQAALPVSKATPRLARIHTGPSNLCSAFRATSPDARNRFSAVVGLNDDPESNLLSRLNLPPVARRSTHSRSLRIPNWFSISSASRPPSPTAAPRTAKRLSHNFEPLPSDALAHPDTPDSAPSMSSWHQFNDERRALLTKKRDKVYDQDDQFQRQLIQNSGNGIRVWYESYSTIDWLHELIKESIRRKKWAKKWGLSGVLSRLWDRSQAWVLVTLIGICTALVASWIVSMEMYFFDMRQGYCARNWLSPKRFCCQTDPTTLSSSIHLTTSPDHLLHTLSSIFDQSNWIPWLAPSVRVPFDRLSQPIPSSTANQTLAPITILRSVAFTPRSFIAQWSGINRSPSIISAQDQLSSNNGSAEICPDWHHWRELWSSSSSSSSSSSLDWSSGPVYVILSLALAGLSSALTVYLSCSTQILPSRSASFHSPEAQCAAATAHHQTLPTSKTPTPEPSASKVSYFAAGSGIPEIKCILSGCVIRGYLGASTLITKATGLILSVGSGLSLGKEGPLVHIASCIGNLFTRLFSKFDRNEGKRREILSSACAAGVSAAFGAPIGGVLFSLEEVSYFFPPRVMWRSCWCAMVTAATLRILDPFKTGKTVLFEVTYDRQWHFVEFTGFICLGILGGILGALFAKLNVWWSEHFRRLSWVSKHPIVEVLMVTFVTCLMGLSNHFMKLGGTELVYELLAECEIPRTPRDTPSGPCITDPQQVGPLLKDMLAAALLKLVITIVTFGIKCPAGIFIPSLSIGALLGRALGLAVEYGHYANPTISNFGLCDPTAPFGQACVLPGVWAMVGAAAMLAGVTRTTVSLAVIVVELTGSLVYILPISISVLVAKTTADAIERRSIYDLVIDSCELPYLDAKHEYLHYARPIDIMDSQAAVIELSPHLRASDLRKILGSSMSRNQPGGSGFPVLETIDGERRIVGYIGVNELQHSLLMLEDEVADPICSFSGADPDSALTSMDDEIDLGHLMDRAPVTVSIQTPMELLHEMFVRLGVRYLIIQDHYGSYMGIIEKNRWLRYLSWIERNGRQLKNKEVTTPL